MCMQHVVYTMYLGCLAASTISSTLIGQAACRRRYIIQCFRKVAVHLGYDTYIRFSVSKHPYSVKTAITEYIRNISQADLQKVFANKVKRVQARYNGR
jgi:hypothetical protein